MTTRKNTHPSKRRGAEPDPTPEPELRDPTFAIRHLEQLIDSLYARLQASDGDDFARLANCLARAVTALFQCHRILRYLSSGTTPMEEALRELSALEFSED